MIWVHEAETPVLSWPSNTALTTDLGLGPQMAGGRRKHHLRGLTTCHNDLNGVNITIHELGPFLFYPEFRIEVRVDAGDSYQILAGMGLLPYVAKRGRDSLEDAQQCLYRALLLRLDSGHLRCSEHEDCREPALGVACAKSQVTALYKALRRKAPHG